MTNDCPNCGKENPDIDEFCKECGTKLSPKSEETSIFKVIGIVLLLVPFYLHIILFLGIFYPAIKNFPIALMIAILVSGFICVIFYYPIFSLYNIITFIITLNNYTKGKIDEKKVNAKLLKSGHPVYLIKKLIDASNDEKIDKEKKIFLKSIITEIESQEKKFYTSESVYKVKLIDATNKQGSYKDLS